MPQWRSVFVLLVALVLSVSCAVPAEDMPETAYDESDSLPFEGNPVVSIAEPEAALEAPAGRPHPIRLRRGSLRKTRGQRLEHGQAARIPSAIP